MLSLQLPPLPAVELLHDALAPGCGVQLGVLRLDCLHPLWGGNKVYKLWHNLAAARAAGLGRVISFGGAWSNHLHALAACGRELGLETIGIVRGEACEPLSATLRDARDWGMRLQHVSRAEYRLKDDPRWCAELEQRLGPALLVPEGGDNAAGFAGCRELGGSIALQPDADWDLLALACGTGTTAAGLAAGSGFPLLGFAAARDAARIEQRIAAHLQREGISAARVRITERFAGRGFARLDAALIAFMQDFERRTGLPLDPVYTAKLFHGLATLAREGEFAAGTRILALHTGGLQGRRSLGAAARP
jgi:1-aminocyclopropane-1-carboxylate deaminase